MGGGGISTCSLWFFSRFVCAVCNNDQLRLHPMYEIRHWSRLSSWMSSRVGLTQPGPLIQHWFDIASLDYFILASPTSRRHAPHLSRLTIRARLAAPQPRGKCNIHHFFHVLKVSKPTAQSAKCIHISWRECGVMYTHPSDAARRPVGGYLHGPLIGGATNSATTPA